MKRILAMLMAVMMLLGCSAAFAEDKPTISYWAFWCGSLNEGSYVENFVEENLNIDVKIRKVDHNDVEAVNMMLANDMPDCGWFNKTADFMDDQELTRRIPVDMVRQYAPSLAAYMDANPLLWTICADPQDSTQLRYLPDLYDSYGSVWGTCMGLRYDWIEKLGIDLGDVQVTQVTDKLYIADKGVSLDTFHEILDKFVNGDPDGNGVKDTEGYAWNYGDLKTAFGLLANNMEVDGKPCEWYTNPAVKELLAWLQSAYADGLIYKEIFTANLGQLWERIANGSIGVFQTGPIWLNSWANNRPPRTLLDQDNDEIKVLLIPGVADSTGHTYRDGNLSASSQPGDGEYFFVNADVDDEKLATILNFYEWCNWNTDRNVMATLWFGEEGVDWKWSDDGSKPIKLNQNVGGDRGTQVFCRNTQLGEPWQWTTFESDFEAGAAFYYNGIWNADEKLPYKVDLKSETQAAAIKTEYEGDWNTTRDAYFMGVIMGEKNLDSDWDAYIEALNKLEYGAYIEELDKAPTTESLIEK